jgi:anti-sigma factor RsiW
MRMECDAIRDQMLDVLYGEADAAAAASFEQHLSTCPACQEELTRLRELRTTLQAWTLPRQRPSLRRFAPPRYFWAAAAAALVILALGGALGLAGFEMRLERGPVLVRLGGAPGAMSMVAPARDELPATAPIALQASAATNGLQDELVLQRVEEMIRQSEARQQLALRASLTGFEERSSRQRRYDMARVGAGLSYLDGKTGQHMARTTELMGYVLQASNRTEP